MQYKDLPVRWKIKIKEFLHSKGKEADSLSASDFAPNQSIYIQFEDDSLAKFRYAFVLEAPEWGELGLFTEHCGYHLFQTSGLDWQQIIYIPDEEEI